MVILLFGLDDSEMIKGRDQAGILGATVAPLTTSRLNHKNRRNAIRA
jgi:hypothetical protein